jgi:hypothetical protein
MASYSTFTILIDRLRFGVEICLKQESNPRPSHYEYCTDFFKQIIAASHNRSRQIYPSSLMCNEKTACRQLIFLTVRVCGRFPHGSPAVLEEATWSSLLVMLAKMRGLTYIDEGLPQSAHLACRYAVSSLVL